MGDSERAQVVRDALDAWNRRDLEGLLALTDPDVEWVNAPNAVEPGTRHGWDGLRIVVESQWDILAEAEMTVARVVEHGADVITIATLSSRMPDSETVIEAPFHVLWRVDGGKIKRIEPLGPDPQEAERALK